MHPVKLQTRGHMSFRWNFFYKYMQNKLLEEFEINKQKELPYITEIKLS